MSSMEKKIQELHSSPTLVYIVCTGAGAGCQDVLARVPGASNTLLECVLPYSKVSLENFLGYTPEKFARENTAVQMAMEARRKGVSLVKGRQYDPDNVVGLALTGVVGTNRPLRGEHRVFLAVSGLKGTFVVSLFFKKNDSGMSLIGREAECGFCDAFAVNLLLEYANIDQVPFPDGAIYGDDIAKVGKGISVLRPRRIRSEFQVVMPDGQLLGPNKVEADKYVLFEGAFNPLHDGHRAVASEVKRISGKDVIYVISREHPDKGVVSEDDLKARLKQFEWFAPVMVTSGLRLFIEKAEAFPGFSFVIGADTLDRILDSRYYDFSIEDMLSRFEELGTYFFVSKRDYGNGIKSLSDSLVKVPEKYWNLFTELYVLRNVSSTMIRSDKA